MNDMYQVQSQISGLLLTSYSQSLLFYQVSLILSLHLILVAFYAIQTGLFNDMS